MHFPQLARGASLALLLTATAPVFGAAFGAAGSLYAQPALPPDSVLARSLIFRNIGPALMSGRIVDIAVVEAPRAASGGRLGTVMYAGVATGGVWKTTNAGMTWQPMSDSIGVGSIGAVAVAPSNGEIVWVGSGEPNNMRSSSWGIGVFKSTDGGRSWSKPMLTGSQHVGRIVIDPRNPDVVYVAALGPLWGPGGERGVFKTADGGRTWNNVKPGTSTTGFTELVMDPSNPDVIYAASLQRERRSYGFLPGGPESAIYKTTDAGATWTKLTNGLPTGEIGRIGLAVCKSQPQTVYATVHAKGNQNGFYRSDDGGASWRNVNTSNATAWYYSQVRCDPTNPEHVYRLNAASQESSDGGKTWGPFAAGGGVHADAHALWINPEAPEHIVLGNDGGIDISYDKGRTWYNVENIVGAQFYAISVDDAKPFYNVMGGLQDNQTWAGPNRTRTTFGPSNADWHRQNGGDGFYNVPDPLDHNILYAELQGGAIVRYDSRTGERKNIRPVARKGEAPHRYNWSAPIVASKHTPRTVYFGSQYLFKSTDRGDSWTTISPDLTRDLRRNELPIRGAKPDTAALGLHEGTQQPSNLSVIAESPMRAGLIAVGTDDGVVQVSRDDGKTWTKTMSFPGVPDTTYVSRVIFSAHTEGTLYATFDGHRSNDFKPYVYKSTDYGKTWSSITSNLPEGGSVQVIREHHRQPGLLFVGTEFGVFFTIDGGSSWSPLRGGMPTGVPVHDLAIQPTWNDLVVGTHGRGIYILDDLSALEHLAAAKRAQVAYLFPTRTETNFPLNASRSSGMGSTGFTGQNPEHGVRLAYLLKSFSDDTRAKLEIVNGSGTVVRELPVTRRAGLFRPVWDMRVGPPFTGPVDTSTTRRPPGGGGGGFGGFGGPATYPAAPGSYTARLTVAQGSAAPTVLTQKITLLRDPVQPLADAELRALDSARVRTITVQRALLAAQQQADSASRRIAQLRRAADSNSTKVTTQISSDLAALEKELRETVRDIGTPPGTRGAPRPPVMDDEEQEAATTLTLQQRAQSLNELLSVTFGMTAAQRALLTSLPTEIAAHRTKVTKLYAERAVALTNAMRVAGITVPDAPARGSN